MITQLKAELDRINQEIEKDKTGCSRFDGCDEIDSRCYEDNLCFECGINLKIKKLEKQTLKKVSLMWADEMIKIFIKMDEIWAEQPDKEDRLINKTHVINCDTYDELQEIKSLMEEQHE
jgi:hypothetical protein